MVRGASSTLYLPLEHVESPEAKPGVAPAREARPHGIACAGLCPRKHKLAAMVIPDDRDILGRRDRCVGYRR